jgi:hypothetical protein
LWMDDRQVHILQKIGNKKPQKYRENKNALQINKQKREKQSIQARSLASWHSFEWSFFLRWTWGQRKEFEHDDKEWLRTIV